tara:strand:+ start:29403 stop:29657 length:255 start_codon:yes stop_codon:yes gene_type:complete
MDSDISKKLVAVGTAALAAFVFGESQIMEMDERLQAVEEVCFPAEEEADSAEEEAPPALGKPGMMAPPIEDPNEPEEEGDPEEE